MHEPLAIRFAGEPQGSAYECWREEFCRRVIACDLAPLGKGRFEYEVSPLRITSKVGLSVGKGSALQYRTLARDDLLVLVVPQSARLELKAGKRQALLRPGMVGINDSGLSGAQASQCEAGGFMSVMFDRKLLTDTCPDAEDLIARPIPADATALRILSTYMRLIRKEAGQMDAGLANAAAQHLLDLTMLVLGSNEPLARYGGSGDLAGARFRVLKADILAKITDPALDIVTLAGRQKVSVRYIQYLFESAGSSFTEFVLEQRLLLALRLLTNPVHSHRKISDIALLAGFNSLSYFHRTFRRRFGKTPAEAREHV